jgi:hypothetical protein
LIAITPTFKFFPLKTKIDAKFINLAFQKVSLMKMSHDSQMKPKSIRQNVNESKN